MITTLTYAYCITIVWTYQEDQRHQRSGEGQQRTGKTRKQCDGCHSLLIFVKTLFALNDWFPLGQRAFTITEIYLLTLVNPASRTFKIENHISSRDVRSRVPRIIWVQSRVTLQILGPSRVPQKPFATL